MNTPKENNEERKIGWVRCNRCDAWVHCLWVGMQVEDVKNQHLFAYEHKFYLHSFTLWIYHGFFTKKYHKSY